MEHAEAKGANQMPIFADYHAIRMEHAEAKTMSAYTLNAAQNAIRMEHAEAKVTVIYDSQTLKMQSAWSTLRQRICTARAGSRTRCNPHGAR